MLSKIMSWFEGKRTYIVAVLIGIGAVLVQLGYEIPDAVWFILAAAGLGAVRSAIEKLKQ